MRTSLGELLSQQVVLLDGGMGSALLAGGAAPGTCLELTNLQRPELVQAVHADHLRGGAVVLQTNTFGASPLALARHGLADRFEPINRAAVELARAAIAAFASAPGHDAAAYLVAGNIGPSGSFLPPVGSADLHELKASFAAQAEVLEASGVDSLSIETMSDLREASCALAAARHATSLPVTVCLTYEQRKRGFFTLMGDQPEVAVQALAEGGAIAVGANCSVGSTALRELCPILVAASPVPVICKPNAGLPELHDGRTIYRQSPQDFAADMVAMVRLGARAVGGCCGTDGKFLAAVSRALEAADPERARS
jgi:5-methyltetrahydrofolate--homocysteine methyltransferase